MSVARANLEHTAGVEQVGFASMGCKALHMLGLFRQGLQRSPV